MTDPSSGKEYHAYDESYALVVGIDAYTHADVRTSAVSSATAFRELLMSRFGFRAENIAFLLNDGAKKTDISEALEKFRHLHADDRLLIFLSGRGYTAIDETKKEYGFFVPVDGDVRSPGRAVATCIPLDAIGNLMRATAAKSVLTLMDFTVGGLPVDRKFTGVPPPRVGFQRILSLPSKEIFAAGGTTESQLEDPSSGLSYFTSKLIETLSSETADVNDDGIITGTEMAARTSIDIMAAAQRRLHPQFGFIGASEGDFPFILPNAADTSHVSVLVAPSGAQLFIDNKEVKEADGGIPVVSPTTGVHTLRVTHEGYNPFVADFFVNGRVSVRADIDLEQIPPTGLLVKVSAPDAKISVDGKFVGMPDASLFLAKIENGKHTVRADLEGYFSDSASVVIEKPVQYVVFLKLIPRNGFITVHASKEVVITLNGTEIGTESVLKKEVLPGSYTIGLSGIGYSSEEHAVIVHDTEKVVLNYPMSRPTLAGALVRSAVFPGWGQSYSGRHGIVYSGIFILCAAASVDLQLAYAKANSNYMTSVRNYSGAQNQADSVKLLEQVTSNRTKKNNANYYRFAAFGVTGAFYLYSILNVWNNDPAELIRKEEEESKQGKGVLRVSLGFAQEGPAVLLSYRF
ncbi:MAG TPA: DUF5683 domain-containing protein [Bacteroidota bacterium]|nr:DUF5683 domain-containing protein [Bacteroidota bacterium]